MNGSHTTNYSPAFAHQHNKKIHTDMLCSIYNKKKDPFHLPNVQAINKGIVLDEKRATVLLQR